MNDRHHGRTSAEHRRRSLAKSRLCVLMDGAESTVEFRQLLLRLIHAEVDIIQLRDKRLADRDLIERLDILVRATCDTPTLAILNDRPDLAVQGGADGVHLGQDDLAAANARALVGDSMLLGISTHNIEQARRARADGADYLGAGPIFASTTKSFDDFPGLDFLRELAAEISPEISLPVFAIGGITGNNLQCVLATGIRRVAVSGAVMTAPEPEKVVFTLREKLR